MTVLVPGPYQPDALGGPCTGGAAVCVASDHEVHDVGLAMSSRQEVLLYPLRAIADYVLHSLLRSASCRRHGDDRHKLLTMCHLQI